MHLDSYSSEAHLPGIHASQKQSRSRVPIPDRRRCGLCTMLQCRVLSLFWRC